MSVLAARGINLSYGPARVLDGADLELRPGELLGLIGPNGAGKTSLLRVMAGLLKPEAGTLTLDGRPLADLSRRERARAVSYLSQGRDLHWPLTAERLVELGRLPHLGPFSRPGAVDAAAVEDALTACDALAFRHRPVTSLSGGERARVLLARALASEPALLLADEPVAGLDPYHQLQVMEVLRARADAGTGVLVVLHDLALAARFCTRLALFEGGRVAAEGPPGRVLDPARLGAVYGVEMATALLPDGERLQVPWRRLDRP